MTRQSATEVMDALEGEFAGIADAIGRAEFAFWLGSGISRSVVPRVSELLRKVIVHLQQRIDREDADCPFRVALREVLTVGGLLDDEVEALNFDEHVNSWDGIDGFVDRMVGNYSKVLEVPVGGVAEADLYSPGSATHHHHHKPIPRPTDLTPQPPSPTAPICTCDHGGTPRGPRPLLDITLP